MNAAAIKAVLRVAVPIAKRVWAWYRKRVAVEFVRVQKGKIARCEAAEVNILDAISRCPAGFDRGVLKGRLELVRENKAAAERKLAKAGK